MRTNPPALVSAALVLLLATPSASHAQAPRGDDSLRLAPGDAVRMEIFESLSRGTIARERQPGSAEDLDLPDYSVDASGRVLLPVAGLVQVAGRPFGEVRQEVERVVSGEFTDAAIRLTPLLRIAVLGEVRSPRLLAVDPTMTFTDVLAAAGGLTELANQKDVTLVRSNGELVRADARQANALNIPLASGDRIVVGRRSWISANLPFVLGAGASVVASVLTALIVR